MRRIFIALAALATVVTTAQADVYKSVDAQGQVHYSDQWSPGAELIRGSSSRPASQDTPPPPPPRSDPSPEQAKSSAAKAVHEDMDAIKADQCKALKEQYDKIIHARRIYQAPAAGGEDSSAPKQYMSDAEADAERVRTRQAMDEACGNG
jgi:hypothetical protein